MFGEIEVVSGLIQLLKVFVAERDQDLRTSVRLRVFGVT
jgi:hypothetical protein